MREADPGVLHTWYADDAAMRGTGRQNAKLLRALTEKRPYHAYFPQPENIWHICAEGNEEEEAKAAFEAKGLKVRFARGQRYLGRFCGVRE